MTAMVEGGWARPTDSVELGDWEWVVYHPLCLCHQLPQNLVPWSSRDGVLSLVVSGVLKFQQDIVGGEFPLWLSSNEPD